MTEDTSKEVVEETSGQETETTKVETSESTEETQQETPQFYGGQYNSQEEFEKAHKGLLKKLNEQGQEITNLRKPTLAPDKQEIADEIKDLGFVTKAELKQQTAMGNQKAKDDLEISSLDITDAQANTLRRYASHKDNLAKSMTELWDELQGNVGGKVVSRKTTIKPKTGTHDTFKPLGQVEIAKLSKEDYDKYWVDYAANKANQ